MDRGQAHDQSPGQGLDQGPGRGPVRSRQVQEDIAGDQGPAPDQGRGLRGLAQGLSPDQQRYISCMMYSRCSLMILFRFMAIVRILNHQTVLECSVSTSRPQRETWIGSLVDLEN